MSEQEQQTQPGPDVLRAFAYGDDIDGIQMAALDQARDLFGKKARLKVESTGTIGTATCWKPGDKSGRFCAHVYIRRLDLPEDDS